VAITQNQDYDYDIFVRFSHELNTPCVEIVDNIKDKDDLVSYDKISGATSTRISAAATATANDLDSDIGDPPLAHIGDVEHVQKIVADRTAPGTLLF